MSLFKPRTLYPLVIDPNHAKEYLALPSLFSNCLAPGGVETLAREAKEYIEQSLSVKYNRQRLLEMIQEMDQGLFTTAEAEMRSENFEGGEQVQKAMQQLTKRDSRARDEVGGLSSPVQLKVPLPPVEIALRGDSSQTFPAPITSPPRRKSKRALTSTIATSPLLDNGQILLVPPTTSTIAPSSSFTKQPTLDQIPFILAPASPEMVLASTETHLVSTTPSTLPPNSSESSSSSVAVRRPSLATRDYRKRLLGALLNRLGGLMRSDGSIEPFPSEERVVKRLRFSEGEDRS